MLRPGKPAEAVLATLRRFPSLEPVGIKAVSSKILGLPTRRDLLWQAVVFERDAERVGSKVIVGREMMGYSNKKLLPQKGSGKARQGDRGSPTRHDGGRAHGRLASGDMSTKLPTSVYSLALRTALSMKYREGHLYLVEDAAEFSHSSELVASEFLKNHNLQKHSVTFITSGHRTNLFDATANLPKVDIIPKEFVQVQDLLKPRRLIVERTAFEYLINTFRVPEAVKARTCTY